MPRRAWIVPAEERPGLLAQLRARITDPATLPQHRAALVRFERLLREAAADPEDGAGNSPTDA